MAINCKRCGGPTMLETVIKLRRSILGFRETRSQGGYCPICRLSSPMENRASSRPLVASNGQPGLGLSGFLSYVADRGRPVRRCRMGYN